jgi:hypothetical protein
VVFIESLPFTRRLHELAKTDAVEVLTAIQSICSAIRNADVWFRGSEGFAKRGLQIPSAARGSVVVCDISTSTCKVGNTFIYSSYLERTKAKT